MIGSETFIIVAFKCTENNTPSAFARAIWAARNSSNAATCNAVASTTSPASTGTDSRNTVAPSSATSSNPQRAVLRRSRSRFRWTGNRRRSYAPHWSSNRPTRPPSNADGSGRTASPTPGPDDQSYPPAAPGSPRCPSPGHTGPGPLSPPPWPGCPDNPAGRTPGPATPPPPPSTAAPTPKCSAT